MRQSQRPYAERKRRDKLLPLRFVNFIDWTGHGVSGFNKIRRKINMTDGKACYSHRAAIDERVN